MGWYNGNEELAKAAFDLAKNSHDEVVVAYVELTKAAISDLYNIVMESIHREAYEEHYKEVKEGWRNHPALKLRLDKLERNQRLIKEGLAVVLPDGSIE